MNQILLYVDTTILFIILYIVVRRSQSRTLVGVTKSNKRTLLLDSCALIDGRIVDLAKAGFTPDRLVVPAFIVRELQNLADGNDTQKRERARFGLDIVKELQGLDDVSVEIDQTDFAEIQYTDDKLIALAKRTKASLYTTDFNLLKVAEVEGIQVLNVNELAHRLRPTVLPGEVMHVKIVQKGSGRGQGVGYADDGTMVVVEQTDRQIGVVVEAVVDRMHNTLAGKMIFAKLAHPPIRSASSRNITENVTKPNLPGVNEPIKYTAKPKQGFVKPKPNRPRPTPGANDFDAVPQNTTLDANFVSDLRREIL